MIYFDIKTEVYDCVAEALHHEGFRRLTLSAPFLKSNPDHKLVAEPMLLNGQKHFQAAIYYGNQVRHINSSSADEAFETLRRFLAMGYKQCQIVMEKETRHILMNKKGCRITINQKSSMLKVKEGHNRKKQYILEEGVPAPWLVRLGIMNAQGRVLNDKQKKFRQINRFMELLDTVAEAIPPQAHILDIGCGKAYLTFALYHYFHEVKKQAITITGVDLKADVVESCGRLARELGMAGMDFICGDIREHKLLHERKADMVVSLHACDTATDYALYGGILWDAPVILSVPCCQHELFGQVRNDLLAPLLAHGIMKERFAALLTDTLRALLLTSLQYSCDIVEFIDAEDTPKNLMLRAVKGKAGHKKAHADLEAYEHLAKAFHAEPTLYKLLKQAGML